MTFESEPVPQTLVDIRQTGLFMSLSVPYLTGPIRTGFSPHEPKCQELRNYRCNLLELAISTQLESESETHINRQVRIKSNNPGPSVMHWHRPFAFCII